MTVTAQQVIDEARTWIETPYRHQGRIKGLGVAAGADCIGMIVGVIHALKLSEEDVTDYSQQPNPGMMGDLLDRYGIRILVSEMRPGNVLWLRYVQPQHVALFTDRNTIIHIDSRAAPRKARGNLGRCVEHILDDRWRRRIIRVYRIPGVEQ